MRIGLDKPTETFSVDTPLILVEDENMILGLNNLEVYNYILKYLKKSTKSEVFSP